MNVSIVFRRPLIYRDVPQNDTAETPCKQCKQLVGKKVVSDNILTQTLALSCPDIVLDTYVVSIIPILE